MRLDLLFLLFSTTGFINKGEYNILYIGFMIRIWKRTALEGHEQVVSVVYSLTVLVCETTLLMVVWNRTSTSFRRGLVESSLKIFCLSVNHLS